MAPNTDSFPFLKKKIVWRLAHTALVLALLNAFGHLVNSNLVALVVNKKLYLVLVVDKNCTLQVSFLFFAF